MDHRDKEFEAVLRTRTVPPMRSNLEHRIIAAAGRMQQTSVAARQSLWSLITGQMVVPQPALVFSLVLCFGLALGVMGYPMDEGAVADTEYFFLNANTQVGDGFL